MFNTIKLYIIGIGAAILGVLYAIIKYQGSKIDTLEEENQTKKIIIDINEKIEADKAEAEKVEEIKQANIDDSNWRNNI